jgi:predicted dehydrogenase
MKRITRRDFIKSSVAAGAALALPFSNVRGANNDIRLGVIGLGGQGGMGQGKYHIRLFREIPGVRVAAICDADRDVLDAEVKKFKERNETVDAYTDLRKLLDDKSIDAITTATPNHWHALVTIWACQAGKDVYVEKPAAYNIWESRKMIEAARKYDRIVQVGTQRRSDEGLRQAFEYIKQGKLGKVQFIHSMCYRKRESIGKVSGPQPIPESIDYNLWTGPAALVPLMRKNLHYDWHWIWATGNGDLGNNGIHQLDLCRWALGQDKLPRRAMSIGGRFGYDDDDGETANTQIVLLDYKPAPIIYEVRNLPRKKGDSAMDEYRGVRSGAVIQCEDGYFAGGWVYANDGTKVKQFKVTGGSGHHGNFIKAVRSHKVSDLNADILEGHLSTALCHLGNISHRLGAESSPEEIREKLQGDKEAMATFESFQSHLSANEVDIKKTRAVLGPWVTMDSKKEKFVGEFSTEANKFLKRDYRKAFVVPEEV